ncbi:hypothetical protein [Spiroplasma endosymbiont of Colias croceus]|uniref:hypothetical protein n=1 Tax=Spiroplasma endosymbiont of Colias croceus TaxID=3066310 RepID=UPI0030CFBB4F
MPRKNKKSKQSQSNLSEQASTSKVEAQTSTEKASTIEFIEKEITLDENYSKNIKKMLEQLKEEKYIHPARTFDFGGLIAKPFNEKKGYKSETVFDKLDELDKKIADWIKEKAKTQLSILSLSLNNNQNEKIKLLINLENFYVQGFINENKYFHFDDELIEKVKEKNKKEIDKLKSLIKNLNSHESLIKKEIESFTKEQFKNLEWNIKKDLTKLKTLEKWQEDLKIAKKDEKKLKNKLKKWEQFPREVK